MHKVLITGASSGLGEAVGKKLREQEINVINLSRNKSTFTNVQLDLANDEFIQEATRTILKEHSDFDALILNAGIMPLGLIGEMNFDIDELFKTNITGSIKLVNNLLETMKTNQADLVLVGSTAAFKGAPEHAAYCATKHATQGLIAALQTELRDEPVRVIGFHPGGFNSNLRGGIHKKGYMKPEELATLLIHLLQLPKNMEVSQIIINRKPLA
ncbi:MAG: SDR family oxidoreductase [Candidatus Woesearchaeota archaeon]